MTVHNEALRDHACLIVHGPDKPGIVAAVTALVTRSKGNIVQLDQYSDDANGGNFFQRVVFHRPDLAAAMPEIEADLTETVGGARPGVDPHRSIRAEADGDPRLDVGPLPARAALAAPPRRAARHDPDGHLQPHQHRRRRPLVRHPVLPRPLAGPRQVRGRGDASSSCSKDNVDFIVLARYMQIISEDFLDQIGVPVINIHHSFLPAFIGAAPYRKAKERGVKLIGATSHYVTKDLDEGPIIEQDVARVNHAMDAADLQSRGAYVERAVLSRAVQWHAQDRVIRHGNQTIVFTDRP